MSVVIRFGAKPCFFSSFRSSRPRRPGAASRLNQEVQHFAFVVDSAPQPVFPAADLDDHLVEMPARTGARTAAAKIAGDQPPELQKPASYGLVRHVDAAFSKQILDIPKRKREPSVEPNRVLDDLGRKTMTLE